MIRLADFFVTTKNITFCTQYIIESFQQPNMDENLLNDGIHRKSGRPGTTSINSEEIFAIIWIAFMFIYMSEMGGDFRECIRLGSILSLIILEIYCLNRLNTTGDFIIPYFGAYVSCFCGNSMQTFILSVHPYCWHLDFFGSSVL